jgi:antitoxin component of MazEF toxin-antitoxin module
VDGCYLTGLPRPDRAYADRNNAACGIQSEVDLQVQNRTLIMKPPRTNRQGWFDEVAEQDPAYELAKEWDSLDSDDESGDWQW